MSNLTRAHNELFSRTPDQTFETLPDLIRHCQEQKSASTDRWHLPELVRPQAADVGHLELNLGNDGNFCLNDWSFSQCCKLAGVGKETVNKVSTETAARIFRDTLQPGRKPLQVLTQGDAVRAVHGASYTRLYNAELLAVVQEFASDFGPPQKAMTGGTGLYCGEQDMFAFLIDPTGWTEIGNEICAPGCFLWNSEVGKRSVGIETFWFQAVCQNHIVWDAVEVVEFSRKHTANVHDSLSEVRMIIEKLVAKRDARRDGFVKVIEKAMKEKLGDDADAVLKVLAQQGIPRGLAKEATDLAATQGRFTIFSLVDALTRLTGKVNWIGDRTEADQKAGSLLALAL